MTKDFAELVKYCDRYWDGDSDTDLADLVIEKTGETGMVPVIRLLIEDNREFILDWADEFLKSIGVDMNLPEDN